VNFWKILGIAGLVGVAAGGVALARSERGRRSYTPQEIRERLHARLEEAVREEGGWHAGRRSPA
jgi:hypothetical protein